MQLTYKYEKHELCKAGKMNVIKERSAIEWRVGQDITHEAGKNWVLFCVEFNTHGTDETLQFNIIITLSVSSGSATGTVHELVEITPTQEPRFYSIFMRDTCCEVGLSMYAM